MKRAFAGFFTGFSRKTERAILIAALDAAVRNKILLRFKMGDCLMAISAGSIVEQFEHKNIKFTAWNVGRNDEFEEVWKHQVKKIHGVIFVVDASERGRINDAREELWKVLAEINRHAVLLIMAENQDLPFSMKDAEIRLVLNLLPLKERNWHIQATCVTTGDGFQEGLDWLSDRLKKKK